MLQPNELITEDEAADLIGVRPQTLAVWRSTGRYDLPFIRVGRLVRYRVCDLETWIQDRRVSGSVALQPA